MLDGKVIGEFLRFIRLIDQQTPSDVDLIVGNHAIHKTPLLKTPRRIRFRVISVQRRAVAQHTAELKAAHRLTWRSKMPIPNPSSG